MKKLITLALLTILVLSIASASMSSDDKSALESATERVFKSQSVVCDVDAEVTTDDDLKIFIIPTGGSDENTSMSLNACVGLATGAYLYAYKNYPDTNNLQLLFGAEKNVSIIEMYGLRSWIEEIKPDQNGTYSEDDIGNLALRIFSTMKQAE
jgi:hypothetical protein